MPCSGNSTDLDVKYSVVEAVCLFLTRNLSHDAPIPADYHGKVTWLDALLKRLDKDQRLVLIFDVVNEHSAVRGFPAH